MLESLARGGGTATPGELGRLAGVGKSVQAAHIKDLSAARLVDATNREVRITPLGQSYAGAEGPALSAGAGLDLALAPFPPWHRAFLRLLISAVVARWHLAEAWADAQWPGFVVLGGTKVGKSAMADWMCRMLGLELAQAVRILRTETKGGLLGRVRGDRFVASALVDLPFVCFDEFDKAEEELKKEALVYMLGRAREYREGAVLLLRPTPMLAYNPPDSEDRQVRLAKVPEEYRRRAVVLDLGTDPSVGLQGRLRTLYGPGLPALALERLRPPADRLPEKETRR